MNFLARGGGWAGGAPKTGARWGDGLPKTSAARVFEGANSPIKTRSEAVFGSLLAQAPISSTSIMLQFNSYETLL